MENRTIARSYAKAIYSMLENKYEVDSLILTDLSDKLFSSKDALAFLNHPVFSMEEKIRFLKSTFKDTITKEIEELMKLLIEKKRIDLLPVIIDELEKVYCQKKNMKYVEVVSAVRLSNDEIKRLSNAIAGWIGRKTEVSFSVDPAIISGLTIKYDDRILDNSIISELKNIKENLLGAAH